MATEFTGILLSYLKTAWFWALVIFAGIIGILTALILNKRRRLNIPAVEVIDFGNHTGGINTKWKAGYFGEKTYAKMLFSTGRKVIKLDNGDDILDLSTEDYQYVNNKKGIWFYRDPINKNIAVPINKVFFDNKELVAEIAPASYREHAVRIIKDTDRETGDWKDKIWEYVAIIIVVIGAFLIITFVTNYASTQNKQAQDLLLQAGAQGAQACKDICKEAVNVVINRGSAP